MSQLSQVGIKTDIWTKEYNLNYQFKYLKSVAEFSSIVMTALT